MLSVISLSKWDKADKVCRGWLEGKVEVRDAFQFEFQKWNRNVQLPVLLKCLGEESALTKHVYRSSDKVCLFSSRIPSNLAVQHSVKKVCVPGGYPCPKYAPY